MALTLATIFQRARTLNADVQQNGISDSDLVDMYNQVVDEYWQWLEQNAPYLVGKASTTVSYVNGTQEYALPTDAQGNVEVERILVVEVTDLSTSPIPLQQIAYQDKDNYPLPGEPFAYYMLDGNIGFVPIPSRTATGNVKITYVQELAPVVYDSGGNYQSLVPSVPGPLHSAIVYDLALLMRERDQLPVQTVAALAERLKRRFLLNAKKDRGEGIRYARWQP